MKNEQILSRDHKKEAAYESTLLFPNLDPQIFRISDDSAHYETDSHMSNV